MAKYTVEFKVKTEDESFQSKKVVEPTADGRIADFIPNILAGISPQAIEYLVIRRVPEKKPSPEKKLVEVKK